MTQPDAPNEDRTPPDVAVEPATPPQDAGRETEPPDDDVEGHIFTGALKDKDRFA